ncbi:hypothetical protein BJY04DRAFT_204447 [Aspergillus karnatakaensis]|uniref:putative oxidoreductase, 2OG-Fe(II) oxygenase family n=1 Tax=Aspergillus karnatakaensis TaxID=1810916 RepID=UPI003CCD3611
MDIQVDAFPGLPRFPDDVPTAPLLRLSLKDLLAGSKAEVQRLVKACEDLGFFYLDLRDAGTTTHILEDADKLFEIGADLFELPLDEKQKYDLSSKKSYFGYKAQGAAVVDRQGNLDRNEFYNVSKDDIMGVSKPLPAPDILNNSRDTLKSFMGRSHSIVTLILNLLNTNLGLPESTLANVHRLHAVSGDQVRFIKAPPQPQDDRRTALGEHTDFGSVTILFNRLGGLQVLPPGADETWLHVRPIPGHAIINLGDAMVKFTNGLLRSNIHRVVAPPGEQANSTRYSLVYFARPEDDVRLRRLEGSSRIPEMEAGIVEEDINSKDWIIRRALGRRIDVPDIEYEKSAGTEMLSRRLKAYPRSWVASPPGTPLPWVDNSPITTPGSSCKEKPSFEEDPIAEIAARRKAFISSNWDIIRPLLGHNSPAGCPLVTEGAEAIQTRPYIALNRQPPGLRGTLKPYQLKGLSWLLHLRNNGMGAILGDDMGLGKTLQTLSLFQYVKDHEALNDPNTPIQNNLSELWSILHWLYPDVFVPSSAKQFEKAFSLSDGKFDSQFLSHVSRFLGLIMLRRTKGSSEVGFSIPRKKEIVLSVPLTDLQLSWYHRILTGVDTSVVNKERTISTGPMQPAHAHASATPNFAEFINLTNEEWEAQQATSAQKKKKLAITTNTLMELRKCSIHPYLLVDALPEEYHIGPHIVESSGKFIVLQKLVHQFVTVERKKIIIFSGFDQALNLCEDLLEMERAESRFQYVRLDGSTSAAWRKLSVFLFQNDPHYKVFLLSIRAGGEGLNLISSSTVIFLDDDWNPQVMRQAESRVHRIGQTQPVTIFRLHSKGTVEDQMRRRLAKKAYLSDKVMQRPGSGVHNAILLDEEDEQEISLMPTEDIVSDTYNATNLACSSLQTILGSCSIDEISAQQMSPVEQQEWLRRSERVRTNIFNGEKVNTKARGHSVYEETVLGVSKASRRIGMSRTVMIGEWEVSRESVEAASLPSPTFPKAKPKIKQGKVNTTVGMAMTCPHHRCYTCEKTATEAGRLLLSCLVCPRAYCESCLDWGRTVFVGADPGAKARDYVPSNAFFIECSSCRGSGRKRQKTYDQPESTKRARLR